MLSMGTERAPLMMKAHTSALLRSWWSPTLWRDGEFALAGLLAGWLSERKGARDGGVTIKLGF